jgi:hypothetical protein
MLPAPKGRLAVSGIPDQYNGKYILAVIQMAEGTSPPALFGAKGADIVGGRGVLYLVKIEGNVASIPLYYDEDNEDKAYEGSGSGSAALAVYTESAITIGAEPTPVGGVVQLPVTFSNGNGSLRLF